MKHISNESIEKAVAYINELSTEDFDDYAEQVCSEQSCLVGYAMSSTLEFENENLMNLLMYYFHVYYNSFQQEQIELKTIDDEFIDAFQEDFFSILDEFQKENDVSILTTFSNQSNLISFLISEMNNELENDLDSETADQLFLVSTGVISILSKAACK